MIANVPCLFSKTGLDLCGQYIGGLSFWEFGVLLIPDVCATDLFNKCNGNSHWLDRVFRHLLLFSQQFHVSVSAFFAHH